MMIIRLNDGTKYEVKPNSEIEVKQPEIDVIYLHWESPRNTRHQVLVNRVHHIKGE